MSLDIINRAKEHGDRIAFFGEAGGYRYSELVEAAEETATELLAEDADLNEERVMFLIDAGVDYAAALWGIWLAGGIAVPVGAHASDSDLLYVAEKVGAKRFIASDHYVDRLRSVFDGHVLSIIPHSESKAFHTGILPDFPVSRRAMILFTSGTTNKPKGAVLTHENIEEMVKILVDTWEWQRDDSVPLFLPLHHVHSIVNVLVSALWIGARIEPFNHFDADQILKKVAEKTYSVFTAVPTIYVKMIAAIETMSEDERNAVCDGFRNMRLMMSGSSALPAKIFDRWQELTGQTLLERYGMTEIGMALSNPLHGERRRGFVGIPFRDVGVKLVAEDGSTISGEGEAGEIRVKGRTVFNEYWNDLEATQKSFDDGWFKTGDVAIVENGHYKILGRLSQDIIKSGGYKISALEIEDVIAAHDAVRECAVVGIADETWGEAVTAIIVCDEGQSIDKNEMIAWCKKELAPYKVPKTIHFVEVLPRNALGKTLKPELAKTFGAS